MTVTTVDVSTIEPLTHHEAMRRQALELERTLDLLRSLSSASWTTGTDCPAWEVRAMYQHVPGACEAGASIRENMHQLRQARAYRKQHSGPLEAALSAVQVRERAHLTPAQIIGRLAAVAPHTARSSTRMPALVRDHAKLAVDGPVHETWKLGYLIDIIYLRDLGMHRIDAARATRRRPELNADHDGRIVARHRRRVGAPPRQAVRAGPQRPRRRQLRTQPAGAERMSLDAVEFCRALAARAPATGLPTTIVPFQAEPSAIILALSRRPAGRPRMWS